MNAPTAETPPHGLPPRARYAADLARGFAPDAAQAMAVEALQDLFDALLAAPPKRRLFSRRLDWPPVPGLYLWGGVGRGKTYLMDVFYDALPFGAKSRTHFHRFMVDVHAARARQKDIADPLIPIAESIAATTRVLCFDEFFVSDIADAMILGRLMSALFERGVTLVATSNIAPDDLYRDGLKRDNFLPAIATLKEHVGVLNVDGGTDHRLRRLTPAEVWETPCDAAALARLSARFAALAGPDATPSTTVLINDRAIRCERLSETAAWFRFDELCRTNRSAADYVELARQYAHLAVSHVPVLGANDEDAARRFVYLIDALYDRQAKLLATAEAAPEGIYQGTRAGFEFRRTLSRLTEMRSQEYLSLPHLA